MSNHSSNSPSAVTFTRDACSGTSRWSNSRPPHTGLVGVQALLGYLQGLGQTLLVGSLQAYKLLISPLLGSHCRYHPSCSVYAQTSVQRFGVCKGSWLALRRLLRCGPWGAGGIDEVPDVEPGNRHSHASDCCNPPPLQVAVNRTRA